LFHFYILHFDILTTKIQETPTNQEFCSYHDSRILCRFLAAFTIVMAMLWCFAARSVMSWPADPCRRGWLSALQQTTEARAIIDTLRGEDRPKLPPISQRAWDSPHSSKTLPFAHALELSQSSTVSTTQSHPFALNRRSDELP
jgi:hypothetical protein